jgi:hypothetical protein
VGLLLSAAIGFAAATVVLLAGSGAGDQAVVLGRVDGPSGATLRLSSVRDAGGPCLMIDGLPGGTRGCGRVPGERVPPARGPIGGAAIVRSGGRIELYGETAPRVRGVRVCFRRGRGLRECRSASLIHARDRGALAAAGIRRPFGYFVGFVARRAKGIYAAALDRCGHVLGRIDFDRVVRGMHPTVFMLRPTR